MATQWDDSLRYVPCVRLCQRAAAHIEEHYPNATVYGRWPIVVLLDRPDIGYVTKPIKSTESMGDRAINLAVYASFVCTRDALFEQRELKSIAILREGSFEITLYTVSPKKWSLKDIWRRTFK